MGEVRADDEKVLFVEIWFQDFGYALKDAEAFGSDDDRHDRRDLPEDHLQERQLDLKAMLAIVGIVPESEYPVSLLDEFFSK